MDFSKILQRVWSNNRTSNFLILLVGVQCLFFLMERNYFTSSIQPPTSQGQTTKLTSDHLPPADIRTTDAVNISLGNITLGLGIDAVKTVAQAETWYNKYVDIKPIECLYRSRVGNSRDGGWDVCLAAPYFLKPGCLVYSFGINNDWSFDDAVSSQYGCTVRAFDPSMNRSAHVRGERIHFYPYGLGWVNEMNKKGWKMKTLGTIINEMGDKGKIIDYLKIDIEFSEWPSFTTMFGENILPFVKQLSFEAHIGFFNVRIDKKMWQQYLDVFRTFDELGFKKWYTHHNLMTAYQSKYKTHRYYTYGKELGYLNVNFLK